MKKLCGEGVTRMGGGRYKSANDLLYGASSQVDSILSLLVVLLESPGYPFAVDFVENIIPCIGKFSKRVI